MDKHQGERLTLSNLLYTYSYEMVKDQQPPTTRELGDWVRALDDGEAARWWWPCNATRRKGQAKQRYRDHISLAPQTAI
jgi:hypothetical protein